MLNMLEKYTVNLYNRSHDLIGDFYTTVNELQAAYKQSKVIPVINEKKKRKKGAKYKNSGTVRKKVEEITN